MTPGKQLSKVCFIFGAKQKHWKQHSVYLQGLGGQGQETVFTGGYLSPFTAVTLTDSTFYTIPGSDFRKVVEGFSQIKAKLEATSLRCASPV